MYLDYLEFDLLSQFLTDEVSSFSENLSEASSIIYELLSGILSVK